MKNEVKYYYIPSNNKVMKFVIQAKSSSSSGEPCYLATDVLTGNDVWLYKDCIEFCNSNKPDKRAKHTIVPAYESKTDTIGIQRPYQYIWGGQIRDSRDRSMCARPYFNR